MSTPRRLLAALALLLATGASQAAIDITDDRGRHVVLAGPAQRVVSLLPSLTETVCALGACNRLVGVDRYSNWPASVKTLPQLGGLEDTQIERLVALKPDLVLVVGAARAIDRLEALGIPVMALEPNSLQDTQRVLDKVAQALGDRAAGLAAWQRIDARIAAAAARVPPALRGKRVYFEVAASPYAAGAASFVGETLTRLGMGNVVPAAQGPFPKLNPEFVVRAKPDIVMATARALAEMPARPGWAGITALTAGMSCGFEPTRWDPLVRPGPRLAEAAEILADCLVGLSERVVPTLALIPAR
jgi:iron complex transport system substrate-binding protein